MHELVIRGSVIAEGSRAVNSPVILLLISESSA